MKFPLCLLRNIPILLGPLMKETKTNADIDQNSKFGLVHRVNLDHDDRRSSRSKMRCGAPSFPHRCGSTTTGRRRARSSGRSGSPGSSSSSSTTATTWPRHRRMRQRALSRWLPGTTTRSPSGSREVIMQIVEMLFKSWQRICPLKVFRYHNAYQNTAL